MLKSNIKRQTSNILKVNREELDALPFAGLGIKDNALLGRAVFGGRFRIQHLQRVAAVLEGTWNHARHVFTINRRCRRWPFHLFFAHDRRPQSLRAGGGGERDQDRYS